MEVIEHISEKDMFISALKKLLKPEGYLFISTADKSNESYLKLIVLAEYLTRIVPPGTHQWELFISPLELEKILKKYNMEISNVNII
jgi:ubiquinone biosynthesis O-methyltransferase